MKIHSNEYKQAWYWYRGSWILELTFCIFLENPFKIHLLYTMQKSIVLVRRLNNFFNLITKDIELLLLLLLLINEKRIQINMHVVQINMQNSFLPKITSV